MDFFSGGATSVNLTARSLIVIRLSSRKRKQLDDLLAGWSFEVKVFLRDVLGSHFEDYYKAREPIFGDLFVKDKGFQKLRAVVDSEKQKEGSSNAEDRTGRRAYVKAFKKELTFYTAAYLLQALDEEVGDVVIPEEFLDIIYRMFLVHLRGERDVKKKAAKKSLMLVTGKTGSGKTCTIRAAIKKVISGGRLVIRKDFVEEKKDLAKKYPFRTLPVVKLFCPPKELRILEKEEEIRRRIDLCKRRIGKKILSEHYKKKLAKLEPYFDEADREYRDPVEINYGEVSPSNVQTPLYGATGGFLDDAMGAKKKKTVRHMIEAHGILSDRKNSQWDDVQAQTLSATANKIMDEIISGERSCMLIADTHSPEEIASDTFRRFNQFGVVKDISDYWQDEKYLKKLVNMEAKRNNIELSEEALTETTNKVFKIFEEKGLSITPAYVRSLVASVIEQKGCLKPDYLSDQRLLRRSFEKVALNLHKGLYKKVVKKFKQREGFGWEDYQGDIKFSFLEKITSTLFYGGDNKGVVLVGPPGSGKTFLVMVVAATHPEISYISAGLDDLYKEGHAEQGIIKNIRGMYDIGKMLAPSLIVLNEADAIAQKRSTQVVNAMDKVTNKILDLLSGEESVRGVFTAMTTNLFENLDPALTRPGRLEPFFVSGKLTESESFNIIERKLRGVPRHESLTDREIYLAAKSINNLPAGFADFTSKLADLQVRDFKTIEIFKEIFEKKDSSEELFNFLRYNTRAILRILEAVGAELEVIEKAKKDTRVLFENTKFVYELIKDVRRAEDYPLKVSHLKHAKEEMMRSPQQKSRKSLDEFLTSERSREPQVGKIMGAAFVEEENRGVLVPINTNLIEHEAGREIIVTGAAKMSSLHQPVDITEMTTQSAREALTLNIHYLQRLLFEDKDLSKISAAAVIGGLLKKYSIHHQLATVHYVGGGPSAGFALAINTLSVLFNIPVFHDFGITGAPGTKGVSAGKVGSSVIIGGEEQKAERVLVDLDRMFVPRGNYKGIPLERLRAYWEEGKIIIPVGDFRDLIPEVLCVDNFRQIQGISQMRIELNKKSLSHPSYELEEDRKKIKRAIKELRQKIELVIKKRLVAMRDYFQDARRDRFASLDFIFRKYGGGEEN